MNRVFDQQARSISEVEFVAIAIKSVGNAQRHVGILHRVSNKSVQLLHLAWHQDLQNSPPPTDYHWVDLAINARRLKHVAARCRQVFRANPDGLPYAFSSPNDCFDNHTGAYLLGSTQLGLTCASFVLAVFRTAGIQLIDDTSWPISRDGDHEWREHILSMLEHGIPSLGIRPAPVEHVDAVRSGFGSVRIRPEEVAGSGAVRQLPADFHTVEPIARYILQRLA